MPRGKPQFSVALLIETSSTYGRQILRGIQRFIKSNTKQEWIAVVEERDLNATLPGWFKDWSGDGIISRRTTDRLIEQLKDKDIAFVDLTDRKEHAHFSTVRSDDIEIGRLGANHLQQRGLQKFAFCGFRDEAWSNRRQVGFEQFVNDVEGAELFVFQSDWHGRHVKRWEEEKSNLTAWLSDLPKPIGIMACNDVRGKQLIDCCYQASIRVPESVAILGVDNDELLCDFCHTPLSSVTPNAEGIGFRAAQKLSRMLINEEARNKTEIEMISPLGVVARRSSDIVAVEDEELAIALRFIRDHACHGISVTNVINATGISRSSIERKFRNVIQRSPQQEIRRVQLEQVRTLLSGTELAIETIALECGYEHPEYLHVVFKREFGMTPGEYRDASSI